MILAICVFVADEVQIIGDQSRGVHVETLLTLLRQGGPGQFIGLSAVLNEQDGQDLANWLDVRLVRVPHREKHLRYECRTPTTRFTFHTGTPDEGINDEPVGAWHGNGAAGSNPRMHEWERWDTCRCVLHA